MSSPHTPKNPDRAFDDDSWEQLEADLFGIPYTKEHVPTPEAEPLETPSEPPNPSVPQPVGAESLSEPEAALSPAADPEAPSDEFGFAESPPVASEAPPTSASQSEAGEPSSDSYWNALENFDWTQPSDSRPRGREDRGRPPRGDRRRDESRGPRRDGGRHSDQPHRGASAARPPATGQRRAPESQSPTRKPPPASVTDDFGEGLMDSGATPASHVAPDTNVGSFDNDSDLTLQKPAELVAPVDSTPGIERVDSSHGDDQGDHRRRRRRRRRGRRGEGREAPPSTERPARETPVAAEPTSEAEDDWAQDSGEPDDEFGNIDEPQAESVVEPEHDDRRPRQRRRGRRGDDRSSLAGTPNSADHEAVHDVASDSEPSGPVSSSDEDADPEGEELDVSYGHVPSWEEAISYLLNPGLVEAATAADAAHQADHGRSSRHRGHRRH